MNTLQETYIIETSTVYKPNISVSKIEIALLIHTRMQTKHLPNRKVICRWVMLI